MQDESEGANGSTWILGCCVDLVFSLCADTHKSGDDVCVRLYILLPLPLQLRDQRAVLPGHAHPCQHRQRSAALSEHVRPQQEQPWHLFFMPQS